LDASVILPVHVTLVLEALVHPLGNVPSGKV